MTLLEYDLENLGDENVVKSEINRNNSSTTTSNANVDLFGLGSGNDESHGNGFEVKVDNNHANDLTEKKESKSKFSFIKKQNKNQLQGGEKENKQPQTQIHGSNNAKNLEDIFNTDFSSKEEGIDLLNLGSGEDVNASSQKEKNMMIFPVHNENHINDIFIDTTKVEKQSKLNDLLFHLNSHNDLKTEIKEEANSQSIQQYNQFNTTNFNSFAVNTNNNNEKIVLCDNKNFNYEKIYGKEEKPKDSFSFISDILK